MPGLVARTQVEFQPPPAPVPGSLCWSPAAYPWWGPCPPVKSPPVRCGVIGHACCRGPSAAPPSPSLFSSVQALSRVRLFATPWPAARQASLSITNSRSLLKPMSMESVTPPSLRRPLLLLLSIFPNIRVFSNESVLLIRWPKYWSFSFISPSNEHPGLISFRMDWLDLLDVQGTLKTLLQ